MRKTCNFSEIFCKACVFMSMCLGLLASGWGFLELFFQSFCVCGKRVLILGSWVNIFGELSGFWVFYDGVGKAFDAFL